MAEIPKVRTIPQLVKEIREQDPESVITEPLLRRMVKEKKIPHIEVNGRIYISLEAFYKCMTEPTQEAVEEEPKKLLRGRKLITPIAERVMYG